MSDSGVYLLRSVSIPRMIYVGSTSNLRERKNTHFNTLSCHISQHKKLQDHVIKYGIEDLRFIIIERCPKSVIKEREFYWFYKLMPELNTHLIYNENARLYQEAKCIALKDITVERDFFVFS